MKKLFATLLVLTMSVATLTGCGSSSSTTTETTTASSSSSTATEAAPAEAAVDSVVFQLGTAVADTHPYALGSAKFGEIVSANSDGGMTVDIFNNGSLGAERDLVEGLQLGTVDFCVVSGAPLASFTDDFLVFDLPFLFADAEIARTVSDSEVCQTFLDNLSVQGIKGLCYFENGFRSVTNNNGPVTSPEDVKGLKIRVMENAMHMAIWQALGADPTPMAWTEVFTALQQGAIDAQENPLAIVDTSKLYEVQDYLSLTNHVYNPAPFLMALAEYNGLSDEYKEIIVNASYEAREFERATNDEMEEEIILSLPEQGMEINEVDLAPFQELLAPVYADFVGPDAGQIDQEVFDAIQAML